MHLSVSAGTEKASILVIDDDPLLTHTLQRVLRKEGYFVDIAHDGYEGIKKARSGYFHLVLCDIRMPGLDGFMTIKHIQEFQEKTEIGGSGFIVITAYGSPDTRKNAFQLGVSNFILKPFDLKRFLETIDHETQGLIEKTPLHEVEQLNQRLKRLLSVLDNHPQPGESSN